MYMKVFFVLILSLCLKSISGIAQGSIPQNEQAVFFPYVLGERVDKKLKIMIIGSHLLRGTDVNVGGIDECRVGITLDFYDIINPMKSELRVFRGDYDNIGFKKIEVVDLYGGYLQWNSTTSSANKLTQYDNTLSAMEKIRRKMIEQYRSNGYEIYQYDFSPKTDGRHGASYKYLDTRTQVYRPYNFERLMALSPLFVPYYSAEDIKSSLHALSTQSVSSDAYVIPMPEKTEKERIAEMTQKENQANALEAEGDRLEKMGSAFAISAYEKYKQAYNLYPTQRVKEKMDAISAYFVVAQGINKLGDGVANAIETIDPQKKTRFALVEFRYAGLFTSNKSPLNQSGESPSLSTVGFLGHRTCLSLGVRFGYLVAPAMEYTVKNLQTGAIINETMRVQQSAVTLGLSGGLNIPLRNLVISGLYSYDIGFTVGEKILSPGFDYDSDASSKFVSSYPMMSTYSIGFNHVFPKAGIGWGVYYNISSMNGEEIGGSITYKPNAGTSHSLQNTTQEKYKFSNISISLFFFSKGEKKK